MSDYSKQFLAGLALIRLSNDSNASDLPANELELFSEVRESILVRVILNEGIDYSVLDGITVDKWILGSR